MLPTRIIATTLSLFCIRSHGQKLEDWALAGSVPDLSDDCSEALNTTVEGCPDLLGSVFLENPRLNSEQLEALCTSQCRSSLSSVRQTISSSCSSTDVIDFDEIIWPATLIIDRLIYTYDLSCRKDPETSRFCDELFVEWLDRTGPLSSAQNCSDCMLGAVQAQLNSPFGYDIEFADDFRSTTSSCNAPSYAFTSPAPYAVRTKEPEVVEEPTCLEPYVVQPGDSCEAIALSQEVSTFAVIKAGALDPECHNMWAGLSLCLPAPCSLYRVQYDDTCLSIVDAHPGITASDFLIWNPNISVLCRNLRFFVGNLLCVSPPGGEVPTGNPDPPVPTNDPEIEVPKPPNGKDESNYPCSEWYTVQDGDFCQSVSIREQIELRDLYFLNPSLDEECTNLLLDIAYCVAPVGDINTYSDYPYSTSPAYTLTSATYTTTTMTLPDVEDVTTPIIILPTAPGTFEGCEHFVQHVAVDPVIDQAESPDVRVVTQNINSCAFRSGGWDVGLEDFLSWNPSLEVLDECFLQEGFRYCALNSSSYTPEDPIESNFCLDIDEPFPDTDPQCNCFTEIWGVEHDIILCQYLAEDSDISVAQLLRWNPWIGPDCDAGLFDGLDLDGRRPVCIGSNSTGPVPSGSNTASPTISPSTGSNVPSSTESSPSAGPTRPGMIETCNKLHTVQEDDGGCWGIANSYGITPEQFYAWNPSVGDDCSGLWLSYAYCVGIEGPTASVTGGPPVPTQPGTPLTCTTYHHYVEGDSCEAVLEAYDLDLATLYKWNPGIGEDCSTVWLGYKICVAGGPD